MNEIDEIMLRSFGMYVNVDGSDRFSNYVNFNRIMDEINKAFNAELIGFNTSSQDECIMNFSCSYFKIKDVVEYVRTLIPQIFKNYATIWVELSVESGGLELKVPLRFYHDDFLGVRLEEPQCTLKVTKFTEFPYNKLERHLKD